MAISIGIAKQDREQVASELSKLLADTYSLYLKTHSFHWNVTGEQFNSLHAMFEVQYQALWLAADEIAERIRTLDVFAPGSYSQFAKLTSIKEEPGVPQWKDMVVQLVEGHEIAAATARATIKAADEAGDEGTADLVTGRLMDLYPLEWSTPLTRSLPPRVRPPESRDSPQGESHAQIEIQRESDRRHSAGGRSRVRGG